MIIFLIEIKALPEKRKELVQTIQAIGERTRKEKGCMRFHLYKDVENENAFSLMEEWKARKDLHQHLDSEPFSILLGAVNLLSERSDITLSTVWLSNGLNLATSSKANHKTVVQIMEMLQE